MNIIEKIIISKFRSFGKKEEIICGDLNIFSGGNDVGKSNVLKALNLFFNEKTNLYDRYNFEHDYNKWFRDSNVGGERNIEIEIHIGKGTYWDPSNMNHNKKEKNCI
jgi:AAA15 family ATPase/GTPase